MCIGQKQFSASFAGRTKRNAYKLLREKYRLHIMNYFQKQKKNKLPRQGPSFKHVINNSREKSAPNHASICKIMPQDKDMSLCCPVFNDPTSHLPDKAL